MKIAIITLGCPKNEVDSELIASKGKLFGWELVEPNQAEAIVVNTCGFIEPAVEESVNTILEYAALKEQGKIRYLIATGCMVQRYKEKLAKLIPEVDIFTGSADHGQIPQLIEQMANNEKNYSQITNISKTPKTLFEDDYYALLNRKPTNQTSAYIRIAEGCSRRCAFCIIPSLRGKQRSRSTESIANEISMLHEKFNTKEFVLVAQETTAYGKDMKDGTNIIKLLERLLKIKGNFWIRIMYAHPLTVTKDFIDFFAANASEERLIPYIDMPIQHIDSNVLKLMRRGYDEKRIRNKIEQLKTKINDLVLRTTFMVGHPGENRIAYERLKKIVLEGWFDYAGAFVFYAEEGSTSAKLKPMPKRITAQKRWNEISEIQKEQTAKNLQRFIGKQLKVLVENFTTSDGILPFGRFYGQAPEIDGEVFISGDADSVEPGEFYNTVATNVMDFDIETEIYKDDK